MVSTRARSAVHPFKTQSCIFVLRSVQAGANGEAPSMFRLSQPCTALRRAAGQETTETEAVAVGGRTGTAVVAAGGGGARTLTHSVWS